MRVDRVLQVGCCGLLAATALLAGSKPVAVSPGDLTGALIGDRCPTFIWGEVDGARAYELVVYRLGKGEEAEPVLRQSLPGSVDSWTPSLDRCLERGGHFAWSVSARGKYGVLEWSAPNLFEVASGPSETEFEEALATVRQYLAQAARDTGVMASSTALRSGSVSSAAEVSGAGSSLCGDSDLQVNGSPVVTVASSTCGAPIASFEYVVRADGRTVDFTFTGSGTEPLTFEWTFVSVPAGTFSQSSVLRNPTIVFPAAGTYSANLTVTNAFGSDAVTRTLTLE